MSAIVKFPISIELPVQWGEMDAFQHVNNVTYLRWFESARIAYFRAAKLMYDMPRTGPIMARQNINYRLPLTYPDTVVVSAAVSSMGTTSFQLQMELRSKAHDLAVAADGDAVIVMFDYQQQKKTAITPELRAAIESLQG
ncbi:MAG TPA: thioesterase family protein [Myxococcales bacterium]|nr:thioesterase family protein [Myxococcales bacterium]